MENEQTPASATEATEFNPFDEGQWSDAPPAPKEEEAAKPPATEEAATTTTTTTEETTTEEVVDEFVADFGVPKDALKAEIEELRKLKAEAPKVEFSSEESRRLFDAIREGKEDDILTYLQQKKKLSSVDTMDAAEAIRLSLQLQNPNWTAEDIQDVFEETYAIPEAPEQELSETDQEYEQRLERHKQQVEKITRRINRDSFGAKQALQKHASELVLPDIVRPGTQDAAAEAASQKELAAEVQRLRDVYLTALKKDSQTFKGFEAAVTLDKDVQEAVRFSVDGAEAAQMVQQLENFDVNGFIENRWFQGDGTPNVRQLMEDVYLLQNRQKVTQKLVNEAAAKAVEHYIRTKKNPDFRGAETTFKPGDNKPDTVKMAEQFLEF